MSEAGTIQLQLPFNIIQITGDITEELAQTITEQLILLDYNNQLMDTAQPIHIIINSGGGAVVAAWQICDIMDLIQTPVYTIGVGNISSAALMIFLNGEYGHRILSKRTSVMSHQYTWGVVGKYDDLKAANSEIDNLYKRMLEFYIEKTGLERQVIEEKLLKSSDKWLTATQAKKFCLADKVNDFAKKSPFTIIKELQPKEQRKLMLAAEAEEETEAELQDQLTEAYQEHVDELSEENAMLIQEINKLQKAKK